MGVLEVRKQQISDIEYFVQSQIDNFVKTKQRPKFSFYKYLISENVDKKTIQEFTDVTSLVSDYEEARSAYNREDPYLVEAYGNFKKSQLREFVELLQSFLEDAKRYLQEKSVRKTKKRRAVPPEKQVGKVKYSQSCEVKGVKYKSLEPKELIGKKIAYIYDFRYNKLSVYHSSGFVIKGTTITNFDTETSWSKKIRHTNEILNTILNTSQIGLKNLNNVIKSTQYEPTGRLSENCIILKVV